MVGSMTRLRIVGKAFVLLILISGGILQTHTETTGFAETGFLSIDCGANSTHVDESGITWIGDHSFVSSGFSAKLNTTHSSLRTSLNSLRYFPGSHRKSCYVLPSIAGSRYLVRASFRYENYDGRNSPPVFNLAIDLTTVAQVNAAETFVVHEIVAAAVSTSLSVCVFSENELHTPFLSTLELRPFAETMYSVADELYLRKISRINFGAKSVNPVRFPDDLYDRIWDSDSEHYQSAAYQTINVSHFLLQSNLSERPPRKVLETAWVSSGSLNISLSGLSIPNQLYKAYLYFADADFDNEMGREFDIFMNDILLKKDLNVVTDAGLRAGVEVSLLSKSPTGALNLNLVPGPTSTIGPIINAWEIYSVFPATKPTFERDASAIASIKETFKLGHLSSGDPCRPIAWEWLSCTTDDPPRINGVNLSAMNLSGVVPISMTELSELTELRLDHNQITGSIPDLSSLKKLNSLVLQNLTVQSPWTFFPHRILDNNQLSGQVPQNLITTNSLKISLGGNPEILLDGCLMGSGTCSQPKNIKTSSQSRTTSSAVVIGVVAAVSATFLTVLTGTFAFFLGRRRRSKFPESAKTNIYTISDVQAHESMDEGSTSSGGQFGDRTDKSSDEVESGPLPADARPFTYSELKKATRNFTRKVGEGSFGSVFYGKLPGGCEIAVRVHAAQYRTQDFEDGVKVLSKVRHQNLVSMIGYCKDVPESLLIYEFLPGGSLLNNLNDPQSKQLLTWNLRLNIALQAATGLLHLHNDHNPPVIHRNMKSSNILLTNKFIAKVADFGLSRLAPEGETNYVSILVKGATSGYLDPEFYSKQKFTEKSDVYGFGVVLLEIICGRTPMNPKLSRAELNLTDWVRNNLETGNVQAIVDPALGKSYNIDSMWKVADIAMYSVEPEAKHRPSIGEVVKELEEALLFETQGRKCSGVGTSFSPTDKEDGSQSEPVYKKLPKKRR